LLAHDFIAKTREAQGVPVAVAYSGGKDSLATLILVYQALGPVFKVFFADTGLELPEVLENTRKVAQVLGMRDQFLIRSAGEVFWEIVNDFGPPARDFRFCCHRLKAAQMVELIEELYEGGRVLVFLGQRRYESFSRAQEKTVYTNSFIPLQIAATPIKNWTALTLWLFLLGDLSRVPVPWAERPPSETLRALPITPLYFAGHERLGCYLCPAATIASHEMLRTTHPELATRWDEWLREYAQKWGLPPEWLKYRLWRFKKPNMAWQIFMQEHGINPQAIRAGSMDEIRFRATQGFSPCALGGHSVKGAFEGPVDLERFYDWAPALGGVASFDEGLGVVAVTKRTLEGQLVWHLILYSDGTLHLRFGRPDANYSALLSLIVGIAGKAANCSMCEVCVGLCPAGAILAVEEEGGDPRRLRIDPEKCTGCAICISHCPAAARAREGLHVDSGEL
jgi:phosphoadenosine phosphosulfate reductase